jgi:hypothetical protein
MTSPSKFDGSAASITSRNTAEKSKAVPQAMFHHKKTERRSQAPEPGSFASYLCAVGFIRHLAMAVAAADRHELEALRRAFPQVVAAYRSERWEWAPSSHEPHPLGKAISHAPIYGELFP